MKYSALYHVFPTFHVMSRKINFLWDSAHSQPSSFAEYPTTPLFIYNMSNIYRYPFLYSISIIQHTTRTYTLFIYNMSNIYRYPFLYSISIIQHTTRTYTLFIYSMSKCPLSILHPCSLSRPY